RGVAEGLALRKRIPRGVRRRVACELAARLVLPAASLLLLFASAASAEPDTPAPPEALHPRLVRMLETSGIRGAAIRIQERDASGDDWGLDWGARNEAGDPVGPDTRFRAGSVSKLVTSLLVLRAEAAGRLSLSDPVSDYVPDLTVRSTWSSDEEPLRIEHLLEHTAGLESTSFADYLTDRPDQSPASFIEARKPFERLWPPGTHYAYSNYGHTIAARIVELAWGDDFDALVRREVFVPLGMLDSNFETEPRIDTLSQSFRPGDDEPVPTWRMSIRPSGALITTANDLLRLLDMLLAKGDRPDGGPFLPAASIERMERGETSLASRTGAGDGVYGLGNFPFRAGGYTFRGHWGKTDGFLTTIGYRRGSGSAFVVLVNTASNRGMASLRREIARVSVEGLDSAPHAPRPDENEPVAAEGFGGIFVEHSHAVPGQGWLVGLVRAKRLTFDREGHHMFVQAPWPFSGRFATYDEEGPGLYRETGAAKAGAALFRVDGIRYWTDGASYREISAVRFYLEWTVLLVGLATAVAFCLSFAVSLARRWLVRTQRDEDARSRVASAIASGLYLFIFVWVALTASGGNADVAALLGRPSIASVSLAFASLLAPCAALAAVFATVRARRRPVFALTRVLPLVALGVLLASHGWVPLITW
ncbi:MAG: serine hydrolase domain-containing protein, partial [Myxococcota bacterium]